MAWKQSRERNKRLRKIASKRTREFRGAYYDEDKGRIIRYYIGSRSKYYRKVSNKKVRRYKNLYADHSGYRKIFDYWWGGID